MVKSSRRRSRRLGSCERQATEFELQEAHKKLKVIIDNDVTPEECIGDSLKTEWRELSHKVLSQLGGKEMTALCQELDVVNTEKYLNSGVHLVVGTNTMAPTAGGISSFQVKYEDAQYQDMECERETCRATVLRAKEREESLRMQIRVLVKEKNEHSKMIQDCGLSAKSLAMRNRQLEESLPIPDTPSRSPEGGKDLKGKDLEVAELKGELSRERAKLEVCELRVGLERKRNEEMTEELIALHHEKAVYEATKCELVKLERKNFEAEKSELTELRGLHRTFEAERLELVALRCQIKELEAIKNDHEELSHAERDELQLLRRLRGKEQSKDATRHADSKANGRNCREMYPTAPDPEVVEQELISVKNARKILLQERISLLSDKKALNKEKKTWLKEKQLLEARLLQANEDITRLQSGMDLVEKEKARLEEDSSTYYRRLFLKQAKIESLKAELGELKDKINRTTHDYAAEEVETLKEANRTSMETERRLTEELSAVKKQLEETASKDVCRTCFKNARDALHLPCSHVQCCVQCVEEMMQDKRPCPSCGREITSFVRYSPVL
ncbi:hypothetical protein R1flu_020159 [Riccia fluitans]|uniref:RING-type domain-containing protein n=1 Tax=Riccia fluitans TaxID=41844 RepID=A0ABD1ZME4_9MARC